MAEKVTTMVLKVDLQCPSCYKKIKKILCKFHQIRNQVYDEKQNTVTITVVCYSPEKIRDKLCFKGGKIIKSIEIKEPPKPKSPPEKPKPEPAKPKPPAPAPPAPGPPVCYLPIFPVAGSCGPCCEGNPGGPCYHGYGRPVPCYIGCRCGCGYGYGYGYGGGRRYGYMSRCDYYFSEENASGCTIM